MLNKHYTYYAEKYKHTLMQTALNWAACSPAKRKKVGAVVYMTDNNISNGFNAMPSGSSTEVCEDEFGVTKKEVRHAEINCLSKVAEASIVNLVGATLFVTLAPCSKCSDEIIKAGISKVYYKEIYRCTKGIEKLKNKGIQVELLGEI